MLNGAQHFFFIAGVTGKRVTLSRDGAECPVCRSNNVSVKRDDLWFSFFFIPLFPIKRGTPFIFCHQCSGNISSTPETTCNSCGKGYKSNYSFCPHCGAKNGKQ